MRLLIPAISVLLLAACGSTPPEDQEDIIYSSEWFGCLGRFECVVVQDSYCREVAVNRRYSIIFQDWSRQQVDREGERIVCPRDEGLAAPIAACTQGRCSSSFSRTRRE